MPGTFLVSVPRRLLIKWYLALYYGYSHIADFYQVLTVQTMFPDIPRYITLKSTCASTTRGLFYTFVPLGLTFIMTFYEQGA